MNLKDLKRCLRRVSDGQGEAPPGPPVSLRLGRVLFVAVVILALPFVSVAAEKLTAFDILDRIDKNMVFKTARSETVMIITIKKRVITKSLISYARGNEQSYLEFLSPARDKGSKILKNGDIIKVYYPSAERVMRLSGHMMRQSMMGSDFSFEDMTQRATQMREEYTGEIKEDDTLNGTPCYVLLLTSKIKKQTYFKRKMWVDKKRFIGLKEELYAKSGKLLKEMTLYDIKTIKNRSYPSRMVMVDKLRKNSQTEMIFKKIEFDIDIPDETFSDRRLMKK